MAQFQDSVPQTNRLDSINQAIVIAHGSATNLYYGFLQKTHDRRPYQPLVEALALRSAITDTTDLNYDCAFVYFLHQKEEYSLYLSLVGNFLCCFTLL